MIFWYVIGKNVFWASKLLFGLRVTGRERLHRNDAFIITSNHQSYLDAPVLLGLLPWRVFKRQFSVGTSEIFGAGIARKIAGTLNLVPVDPDANLVPAMKAGAFGLRHNKVLILFPEGERSIDGSPKKFKKGAAILSANLNVPIIPMALSGFHEAWPRGKGLQKLAKLKVVFGEPIYPGEQPKSETMYESLTAELRDRVVKMWDGLQSGREVAVPAD